MKPARLAALAALCGPVFVAAVTGTGFGEPGEILEVELALVSIPVMLVSGVLAIARRSLLWPRVLLAWDLFLLVFSVWIRVTCDHIRGCGRWEWPALLVFLSVPVILFGVLRLDEAPRFFGPGRIAMYAGCFVVAVCLLVYGLLIPGGFCGSGVKCEWRGFPR